MTEAENSAPDMVMNRILIIGGTGYIGKYMAKASVSLGYPTYVLVRPSTAAAPDSFKEILLQEFKDIGIHILQVSEYSMLFWICSCGILCFLSYLDSNSMSCSRWLIDLGLLLGLSEQGSLDDHKSLVDAIKLVDVVISAVAIPQHLDQFNIINAIKEAGIANIKVYTTVYTVYRFKICSSLNWIYLYLRLIILFIR